MSRAPSVLERLRRDRRGATAVEFALVALALLLFTFGVIETARMLWTWQVLEATAADTARCVAIGASQCTNPQNYAVSLAASRGVAALARGEVTVTTDASCGGEPNFTQVSINHAYSAVLPTYVPAPSGGLKVSACFPNNPT